MHHHDAPSADTLPGARRAAGQPGLVEARSLDFRYGRRQVLRGIDLDLPTGAVGVLGPSGAGKTTLLELVVTRRAPSGGVLRVLGTGARGRAETRDLRRRIGYLPRSFGYHPMFTVAEFTEYCGWLKQVPSARLRQRAAEAIGRVGLADRTDAQLRSLSAAELRRAGLAQALVHRPELVVLDEPTSGLDPEGREELTVLVRGIAETANVLVSGERVPDLAAICEAVLVLDAGRPVLSGPWHALEGWDRPDVPGDSALERGYAALLASRPAPGEPG